MGGRRSRHRPKSGDVAQTGRSAGLLPRVHLRAHRRGVQVKRFVPAIFTVAALWAQSGPTRQNWPHYGGGQDAWRHSDLDQVNRSNVKKLAAAWVFQTGVSDGGLQVTPIVVDGVMYLSSSGNR